MPAHNVTLGVGSIVAGETLDVQLHLNHPDTPVSLGVQWGRMGTGAGYTLQEAAAVRHADHLMACGCAWLRDVAREELLAGRVFSPQEILAYRPPG